MEFISFWQSSTFHFPRQASFSSPLMKATGRTKHTLPHNYTVIKHSLNTLSGGTNDPLFQPHLIAGVHTTSYHYPSMVRISMLLYKDFLFISFKWPVSTWQPSPVWLLYILPHTPVATTSVKHRVLYNHKGMTLPTRPFPSFTHPTEVLER